MKAPKQPELRYRRNSSKAWKRAHPSAPGETPHIQTGTLKMSISYEQTGTAAKVGSILKPQGNILTIDAVGIERTRKGSKHSYAWYLEHGTTRMAPRPYLRRALIGHEREIAKLLSRAS